MRFLCCNKLFINKFSNYAFAWALSKTFSSKFDVSFSHPVLEKYINNILNEYNELHMTGKNSDFQKIYALRPIVDLYAERNRIFDSLKSLDELGTEKNDTQLQNLVTEEKKLYENQIEVIETQIIKAILRKDSQDVCKDVIVEVRAGVGGQEAMLFAKEMFEMYINFARFKGWNCGIEEMDDSDKGGIRHGSMTMSGDQAFLMLRQEAGVHRVQRIPATEKSGRIHTSTISVSVLPMYKEIDIEINKNDLEIETMRSSGPGGQHVNKTDSAVRIKHLPSGIVVECQEQRSQIDNRKKALEKLKHLLYKKKYEEELSSAISSKKKQIGMSTRSEKIRTYNFNQDRITDHRLGRNFYNLEKFMLGGAELESAIAMLVDHFDKQTLLSIIEEN